LNEKESTQKKNHQRDVTKWNFASQN